MGFTLRLADLAFFAARAPGFGEEPGASLFSLQHELQRCGVPHLINRHSRDLATEHPIGLQGSNRYLQLYLEWRKRKSAAGWRQIE